MWFLVCATVSGRCRDGRAYPKRFDSHVRHGRDPRAGL